MTYALQDVYHKVTCAFQNVYHKMTRVHKPVKSQKSSTMYIVINDNVYVIIYHKCMNLKLSSVKPQMYEFEIIISKTVLVVSVHLMNESSVKSSVTFPVTPC